MQGTSIILGTECKGGHVCPWHSPLWVGPDYQHHCHCHHFQQRQYFKDHFLVSPLFSSFQHCVLCQQTDRPESLMGQVTWKSLHDHRAQSHLIKASTSCQDSQGLLLVHSFPRSSHGLLLPRNGSAASVSSLWRDHLSPCNSGGLPLALYFNLWFYSLSEVRVLSLLHQNTGSGQAILAHLRGPHPGAEYSFSESVNVGVVL